ncbi:phage terminase large subunit [Hymenobacter tenuis]
MHKPELELDIHPDCCNAAFWPYLESRARFLLFWGGRDSSKSDFVALKLLLDCLTLPYFKCVLVRDVFNTIGGSQVATLKKVAEREGIDDLFTWGVSPLGIRCRENGNSFVPHGMDNPGKLKSLSDPTHAWYEEANQIAKADAEVLSTSLRSSAPGAYLQEIYTFNPDHSGDYTTFWLWQKFFRDTGHPDATSFGGRLSIDVNGELIEMPYEVLHTTANDNQWCPPERKALYRSFEATDPYRYRVWWLGLWATKRTDNEFYAAFSRAKHVKPTEYLPGVPIMQGWDSNALPYSAMLMCQPHRDNGILTLRFFYEYALTPPRSGLANTGKQFLLDRQANGWQSSPVFLTGDATLRNSKIGEERGENQFKDVQAAVLPALHSSSADLWPKKNAGVMRRRDFINYLLRGGVPSVAVQLDPSLHKTIEDLEQVQTGVDGKVKQMVKDKALGASYQKLGHFSDVWDYIIVSLLNAEYEAFVAGRDD